VLIAIPLLFLTAGLMKVSVENYSYRRSNK